MSKGELTISIGQSVGSLPANEWNSLGGFENPFVSHEFLSALEDSGSVGANTGWDPAPITITDTSGRLVGALPSYVKGHSQGEYVFNHAWADALHRVGGRYYPKMQIAAPFTPATGPRALTKDDQLAPHLLKAAELACIENRFSSVHATFIEPNQLKFFTDAGWLLRSDIQFHWENRGYQSFEEFLEQLSSRKRRALRKERKNAQNGLRIVALTGEDIKLHHWDTFWLFYQDTGRRKWGSPYLTREAFELLGQRMAKRLVLGLAYQDKEPIAGALHFIGNEVLYGRYWGCNQEKPFLHFEMCYYQAIDIAIEHGLHRIEAGAQGGHKLTRGYEPIQTWSAHWIADGGFRSAVEHYLEQERRGVSADQLYLTERTPFKKS